MTSTPGTFGNSDKEPGRRRKPRRSLFGPKTDDQVWEQDIELLPEESRTQWAQTLKMYKTCERIARDYVPNQVDDVWSFTWNAMWQTLLKGPVDNAYAYTKSVCRNECVKRRDLMKAQAEVFMGLRTDFASDTSPLELDADTEAQLRELVPLFGPELSEKEALAYVLKHALRYTSKEIAERMDPPSTPTAVRQTLKRAKSKMEREEIYSRVKGRFVAE